MELIEVVQAQKNFILPIGDLVLAPLGDIHYGVEACDTRLLKEYIHRGLELQALFLGMGDYIDPIAPSNRAGIDAIRPKLYDSTVDMLDKAADGAVSELMELLAPTQGRWIGALKGHHYWTFQDGNTTDCKLADFLGAPFLGDCAALFIDLVRNGDSKGKHAGKFVIWAAHGHGSAQTDGAIISKLERAATDFVADIYLMGHFHRRFGLKKQRINWRREGRQHQMIQQQYVIANTGSYLKGYVPGSKRSGKPTGTYVEQHLLRPTNLGGLFIHVMPRIRNGYVELTYQIVD